MRPHQRTHLRTPLFPLFIFLFTGLLHAEPASYGGFIIDPPPGYELRRAPGAGQVSFIHRQGAVFELDLNGKGGDPAGRLQGVLPRLGIPAGAGEIEGFEYNGRQAALVRLEFSLDSAGRPLSARGRGGRGYQGWGLCVDRGEDSLLALAYGPEGNTDLELLGLSCLDSIAPTAAEQYHWGPITEFTWPRGELEEKPIYNTGLSAPIARGDAEAAQGLVDREFQVLRQYEKSPDWQEAWTRFYRVIRRDSWDRLAGALFLLERSWNGPIPPRETAAPDFDPYALAARALAYIQDFRYERNLMGSDFVNLVSALTEGRGDCDSRALLWALFLEQANIPAGIMVSRDYSHAMGIADIEGPGARFPLGDKEYLVAETTAKVDLGLIAKNLSETARWLGVWFE
jgi:hypothetical protein